MKKASILILVTALYFSFVSCEKVLLAEDPDGSPEENFNYLWQELNNKYTFFEYKRLNWDSVRTVYEPRISSEMNEYELFDVLADMLYELKDGHTNLKSHFDRSRNWSWSLDYPVNFNNNIVSRNYLGEDAEFTGALYNQIIDSVLYVYYSSFGSSISNVHIDYILEKSEGLKGLIIDLRSNGGGSMGNAHRLAAALTEENYPYALQRTKTGPGIDDYSAWDTLTVSAHSKGFFVGPTVLLVNRGSYSATTFFSQMMKANPNVTLMGDKTGGGGGVPTYGELPNGWIFRYSGTQTIGLDGVNIEGGVDVDIRIDMDSDDEAAGIDSIIEAALEFINR